MRGRVAHLRPASRRTGRPPWTRGLPRALPHVRRRSGDRRGAEEEGSRVHEGGQRREVRPDDRAKAFPVVASWPSTSQRTRVRSRRGADRDTRSAASPEQLGSLERHSRVGNGALPIPHQYPTDPMGATEPPPASREMRASQPTCGRRSLGTTDESQGVGGNFFAAPIGRGRLARGRRSRPVSLFGSPAGASGRSWPLFAHAGSPSTAVGVVRRR